MPPLDFRLPSSGVESLDARIRAASNALRMRLDDTPGDPDASWEDRMRNRWTWADDFVAAFPRLALAPGVRLACLYSAWPDERQGRLLAVREMRAPRAPGTESDEMPSLPDALARLSMDVFFREDCRPELPAWVEWDVLDVLVDDDTPAALFERSMFARWITEVVSFGHGVHWPRHEVLVRERFPAPPARRRLVDGDDDSFVVYVVPDDPSAGGWWRHEHEPWPADWRPRVQAHVRLDTPGALLPSQPEGLAALAEATFAVVEFHSYCDYVSERITRHRDWYIGRVRRGSEYACIAEGPGGYVV